MKTITSLPSNLDRFRFKTRREGTGFTVVEGQFFPQKKIALSHRDYLSELVSGRLVSVAFHGHPTPLVTVDGGVVRLVKVEIEDREIKGSREISEILGVSQTRDPHALVMV